MFEDALVESSGKLRSTSKYWTLAALAFNLTVISTVVLVPLLHPAALPRTAMVAMLTVPLPPPAPRAAPQTVHQARVVEPLNAMTTPSAVPHTVSPGPKAPPAATSTGVMSGTESTGTVPGSTVLSALGLGSTSVAVSREPEKLASTGPLHVSSGVAAGSLLAKAAPIYPAIAKAAHVSGIVVLHAVISRSGAIQSLQVLSGPEMLRPSAVDAVRQWRYRPYLLNGEPTDVETTITVNFSLAG